MKKLTAIVKDKDTKEIKTITSEYKTAGEFCEDLRRNGYSVRYILTERDLEVQRTSNFPTFNARYPKELVSAWKQNPELYRTELAEYEYHRALPH